MLKHYLEHLTYTYQNTMLLFLLTVVFGIIITIVNMPIFLKRIKNIGNDIKHYKQLEQMDIKVIVIWECELKECFDYRMESLLEEIKNDE